MRACLWILGIVLVAGCSDEAPDLDGDAKPDPAAVQESQSKAEEFFADWLKSHGHDNVVVDEQGVGVGDNATRLTASLYGSNQHDDGGFVVEMAFRVRLPSGREIVEFVAGMGDTEEQALKDAMANFTLTTFHVVYKAFINADDPHMTAKPLAISGKQRDAIMGDMYMRGSPSAEGIDLHAMRPQIEGALGNATFSAEPHWVKIVYSQMDGRPMTVAVTTDNEDDQALTDAVIRLEWPQADDFYMVKQFIVIK